MLGLIIVHSGWLNVDTLVRLEEFGVLRVYGRVRRYTNTRLVGNRARVTVWHAYTLPAEIASDFARIFRLKRKRKKPRIILSRSVGLMFPEYYFHCERNERIWICRSFNVRETVPYSFIFVRFSASSRYMCYD